MLEDGNIDFRERNAAFGVAATPGESGANIKGEVIATIPGEDKTFMAGQNVRTEARDGGLIFLAERIFDADTIALGTVAASDTVYADVYVQLGSERTRVSDDIKAVEFHYKDGVHWRPLRLRYE